MVWGFNIFTHEQSQEGEKRGFIYSCRRILFAKGRWERPWHRLVTCPLVHPKILGIIFQGKSPGDEVGGGVGGVLRISSDGDDRRIILGLKFSIPGFFGRKIWQVYFFGWLDLRSDLFGYSKDLDIPDYQMVLDGMMKTNTTIQFLLFFFRTIPFNIFSKVLRLGNSAWDFLGVKFWSRDFFFWGGGVWKPKKFFWILVFAPSHLKSGVPRDYLQPNIG